MAHRYITNSETTTAQRCWRKWYLAHYRRLTPRAERMSESRYTGDLVHAALAEMYGAGQDPLAVVTLIAAQDTARLESLLTDTNEGARAIIEENIATVEKVRQLVSIMIEGYIQWLAEEGEDAHLTVVAAEVEVSVEMPITLSQPVRLLSKQDLKLVDQRTNARLFLDHKTVDNFSDRTKWAHMDPQFYFYSLVDFLIASIDQQGAAPDEVIWTDGGLMNMLRKVKRTARATPPFYKRHEIRHTLIELGSYFTRLTGEIQRILDTTQLLDNGVDHKLACPPTPTRDCHWDCQFFQLCPLMDDGSDADGYVEAVYDVGDPLARYATIER